MTKRNYRECDVCEGKIESKTHLRIRRFWLHGVIARLYRWGNVNSTKNWRKYPVDICEDCWEETKREIRERVA